MHRFDLVIENGTILTMDPQERVIENGFVGLKGDTISRVGSVENPAPEAAKRIDARGGLILPGLINGHTHAAMTLFRGLADDLPLMDWLHHYIFPVEQKMDGDFVHTGTLLACAEMMLSGTTTFCDMYLFEEQVARAAREAGMRCLVGEVLYDFPSPNYGPPSEGLAYTHSLIHAWQEDPLVSVAVEPHALFTCSPDLLAQANQMALDHGVPLIMHVAETLDEIEQLRETYGKRPIEHLHDLGLLGSHMIADHCVHLDHWEIEKMVQFGVKAVHNPESNMKLASGIAPIPDMIEAGVTVGLGTDGCASNNNLDLFSEMDMAAKLHKVHGKDPSKMDAGTVLKMTTCEGARVMGLEREIGSIEVGKKGDIIVLDTHKPHLTPIYNPYSHLVYAARGSDVRHTLINGVPVVEDGRLTMMDLPAVLARAREQAERVRAWVL